MEIMDFTSGPFRQRTVGAGEIIFLKDQPADEAYVILKGDVEAGSQSRDGKFIVLARMKAGEMFGEIALLSDDGKRTASTMSEGGCELLVVPRDIFDKRLQNMDPLLHFIIGHLCRRLITLSDRVVDAGLEESHT